MPSCQDEEMGYRAHYELYGLPSKENKLIRSKTYKVSSPVYRRTLVIPGILKNSLKALRDIVRLAVG
jgi:hypothetical protein